MKADRGSGALLAVGFHGHFQRAEVAIDAAELQVAPLVAAPSALARHAEAGVRHQDHQPPAVAQGPCRRAQHRIEGVHVLNAEQEGRRVEAGRFQRGDLRQPPGVAVQEARTGQIPFLGERQQAWADFDARVTGAGAQDVGGENALARADIEQVLAGREIQ